MATKAQMEAVLALVQEYVSTLDLLESRGKAIAGAWKKELEENGNQIVAKLQEAGVIKARKKDEAPEIKVLQGFINGKLNGFDEAKKKADPQRFKDLTDGKATLKQLVKDAKDRKVLVASKAFKDLQSKMEKLK